MANNVVTQQESTPIDRKTRVKSIIGGSAGNLVEWYDWYVYAAFTLYFAPKFFPEGIVQSNYCRLQQSLL